MTAREVLLALGAAFLVLLLAAALYLREAERKARLEARIARVQATAKGLAVAEPRKDGRRPLVRIVALVGRMVARSGLLSTKTLIEFEQTLHASGFRGGNGLALFVGAKLLLTLLLPLVMALLKEAAPIRPLLGNTLMVGSAIFGLLGPDVGVRWFRKRHLTQVEKGVPDALDMLVICAEAGLGLEPAISRVGQEMAYAYPAVAEEFKETASELRITSDMRAALQNLGKRTGLEHLQRLGSVLTQSIQYGTPLSHAMRMLAAEMREETLTRFEARAARLPVLLTVPMIVFILPCLFLIVGGPAIIQVIAAFHTHPLHP